PSTLFPLHSSLPHPDLPSFPTRRSSDLFRFVDAEVVSRVRLARNENPDCVGTVFLDQRPGVDHIPNRPVHRVPARIEAEAVDEDPVERLRPPNEPRLEHRVVEPRPDDLTALRPKREGEVRGEEVRVPAVPSEEQVRDARVHPGVEHALLPDEVLRTALRALRERRGVLPWAIVFPG